MDRAEGSNRESTDEHEAEKFADLMKGRGFGQPYEEFVEGNISIEDYTARIQPKVTKGRGQKRPRRDAINKTVIVSKESNRRLSEFFSGSSPIQSKDKKPNKAPMLNLTDILAELDEDPIVSQEESKVDQVDVRQTDLKKFVNSRKSKS